MKINKLGKKIDLDTKELPYRYPGRIAFAAAGRINVLDLEIGQHIALAGARAMQFPDWHPDGLSIAASNRTIYQQHLVNEQLDILAEEKPNGFHDPSWNPDGSMLVFDRNVGYPHGLYIMNLRENSYHHTGMTYAAGGDWSPDGKRIVFYGTGKNTGLYILDVSSMIVKKLPSEGTINYHPHWHPDNRHLIFVSNRRNVKGNNGFDIYVLDIETGQTNELLCAPENGGCNFPQWSPDGKYVVFTLRYGRGAKHPTTLHIMRADGTGIIDLGIEGTHPTWWMNL